MNAIKRNSNNTKIFRREALFWLAYLLITSILTTLNGGTFRDHLINYAILLPAQMLAAYSFNYYLIPKLYLKKKYLKFTVLLIVYIYVFSTFARLCKIYVAEPITRVGAFRKETILEILTDPVYIMAVYFPSVYLVVLIMFAIKSFRDRAEERHRLEVLEKEKANTELKFLKAQIHPHFLFNTLNSIYSLTLAKSDAAPEVVLKLSDLLDYMLYQCNHDRVSLNKEIALIQGYMDLEKIRYGDQLQLQFHHEIDTDGYTIAPLILLSFVENAFKHGASKNPVNPAIKIELKVVDHQLSFSVINTVVATENSEEKHEGIGNSNSKRQLELHYPEAHTLTIDEQNDSYSISLNIDISK